VIGELEAIRQNRPLHYVIFLDDTFTHPPAWIREFLPLYEQRLQTPFSAHARVDTVTPDLIRSLARAGCRHVVFGVESGSERVRKTILGRPLTDERIREAFAMTQEAGLLTTANYMMGLPGETRADVDQTLAFNRSLGPDDFGFFVYVPYPGTPLADMCQEKGYLPDQPFEHPIEPGESILTMPDLSRDDIRQYFQAFIEARQENYRRRFGSTLPAEGLEAALAQIAADARI
jgi:radical SAM superfamily enzyme YgiQ (UPF0313 family)